MLLTAEWLLLHDGKSAKSALLTSPLASQLPTSLPPMTQRGLQSLSKLSARTALSPLSSPPRQ